MPIVPLIQESAAPDDVRAVFEDIKSTRKSNWVNNFWKILANHPPTMRRLWDDVKKVMQPGALDPLTKELIYVAVSVTNNCEYCINSHIAAARKKGMDDQTLAELVEIVALANAGNRLTQGLQVEVDERYKPKN